MKTDLALILSCISILFTGITAIFSILAYSKVVGMEKSTHQIVQQMVPYNEADMDGPTGEDLDKNMKEAFGFKDLEETQI